MDSVDVNADGQGDFTGTAQVTYTGADLAGGASFFTITVFARGKGVAALEGGAHGVRPGQAASLQLVSQNKFTRGPYKFDFRSR